jgi:thiamine biosynthesis lipoprotein apbE
LQRTQHVAVVALDGLALATSGDYRNFFVDDNGAMQSHVIDPRSGRPVRHDIASLSVLAPTAMRADGLATGLYALGAEAAWAVATQQDLAVCLVTRRDGDFHRILSPAFQAQLQSA